MDWPGKAKVAWGEKVAELWEVGEAQGDQGLLQARGAVCTLLGWATPEWAAGQEAWHRKEQDALQAEAKEAQQQLRELGTYSAFYKFFSCKPNNAFGGSGSVKVRNQTIPVHGLCCAIFCSYLSAEEREGVWCPLFDCLLRPLQSAVVMREATSRQTEKWREMLRHVISAMLGHVGHKKEK